MQEPFVKILEHSLKNIEKTFENYLCVANLVHEVDNDQQYDHLFSNY